NNKEKVVVLGDMLELGENEREFHRDIFDILLNINTNKIYLYGPRMASLYEKLEKNKNIKEFLNKDIKYFENKMEIKKELEKISKEKAVLLKASRGMKLEDIIEDIIED
ncbi:MAG: UDP-N-acetylmuramoyl-tripeptide--D-alanyl-D-alanine ligase, partial [Leptotrichiaceae bacterium]|nr:UDP-N-acetylmuramoyl-tripeptide--D-alanyl-D-alanine ligase [Leptotrichiaceae bacterium]